MSSAVKPTLFYVVRVNGDHTDTHAAASLDDAYRLAQPDHDDTVEWGEVWASDAGAARLMAPKSGWAPVIDVYPRDADHCAHESTLSASGHGAHCRFCGETTQ